eukprot:11392031-Heterocapsa_arctica.AAC.1
MYHGVGLLPTTGPAAGGAPFALWAGGSGLNFTFRSHATGSFRRRDPVSKCESHSRVEEDAGSSFTAG